MELARLSVRSPMLRRCPWIRGVGVVLIFAAGCEADPVRLVLLHVVDVFNSEIASAAHGTAGMELVGKQLQTAMTKGVHENLEKKKEETQNDKTTKRMPRSTSVMGNNVFTLVHEIDRSDRSSEKNFFKET